METMDINNTESVGYTVEERPCICTILKLDSFEHDDTT